MNAPLPASAELGFKLAILGGGTVTVKVTPLLATPPRVTTTVPVLAPPGTGATILVGLQLDGTAGVPLNDTVLVPCDEPKLVPLIVSELPTGPKVGLRAVMVGPVVPLLPGLKAARIAPHWSVAARVALAEAIPAAA